MSNTLHFATIHHIVLSDQILPRLETRAALEAIFSDFDVKICYGTLIDDMFEIKREELIRLRDTIRDGGEQYDSNAEELHENLDEMKLSQEEFVTALDRMIRESAQNEKNIIFTWM